VKGADENMKKLSIFIAIIATLMLLTPCQLTVLPYSPRHCKGCDVLFYASDNKLFGAMMAGEIDYAYADFMLGYEMYLDACDDPNMQLVPYARNGMTEWDINNNYTIPDYPGIRSPTNDVEFRRAIAQATNKDYIVNNILNNFAERIDCPLCAPQKGYANETCCNDPYPYDLDAANARLDAAGWIDWDGDGWRNYPLDWDGVAGTIGVRDEPNMDCLKVYVRSDHSDIYAAGTLLVGTLTADLHLQVCATYATSDVECPIVMNQRNYHIYTGDWGLDIYPTYLYDLFHSDNWYPEGSNYVTGMNKDNEPNYPDLDAALEEAYYSANMAEFTAAVKKASGLLVCKHCCNVPLWSYKGWLAYSKYIVGVCNMGGYGLDNVWTWLNAYRVDNPDTLADESQEAIRIGTISAPRNLNILYSTDDGAKAVLNRISGHLLQVNPYNLVVVQPWIAQDWYETTWFDPQDGENKTKVTYWIRQDVWWHDPVTGEATYQFTAHDVDFSIWYTYSWADSPFWKDVKDVHHTHIIDDYTIEVYFDSLSMFHKYSIGLDMPLLCKYGLILKLCALDECYYVVTDPIVPSDKTVLPCPTIVQMEDAVLNGDTPLVEGVDYEVLGTGTPDYCHNEIHWLRALSPGDVVEFVYCTPGIDPHGYYLGGLDWWLTMYSTGFYYPVDIMEGVGGYVLMNCVDSHWLSAPLGDVDWMWYWIEGPYPRSGYYQVNLYDAVAVLKSYCARGDTCPPNPNYLPGADVDGYDLCHVGLLDAVQVLTCYGKKYGMPP
jgi:ABC-type transport system substrate-binding protein